MHPRTVAPQTRQAVIVCWRGDCLPLRRQPQRASFLFVDHHWVKSAGIARLVSYNRFGSLRLMAGQNAAWEPDELHAVTYFFCLSRWVLPLPQHKSTYLAFRAPAPAPMLSTSKHWQFHKDSTQRGFVIALLPNYQLLQPTLPPPPWLPFPFA